MVCPPWRGHGVGADLVWAATIKAKELGIDELWILTNTAKNFFTHLAWQVRDRANAPQAIAASEEFASLCPASATCMSFSGHSLR